jgi:hypothetical protein
MECNSDTWLQQTNTIKTKLLIDLILINDALSTVVYIKWYTREDNTYGGWWGGGGGSFSA